MTSQQGIDVRLPERGASMCFQDPRSAALYILTAYDIPLLEFLSWTLQERLLIINKPASFTSHMWKFLLLQDQSLTQLKEQIESSTRINAAPAAATGKRKVACKATPPRRDDDPTLFAQIDREPSGGPMDDLTPPTTASVEESRSRASGKRFSSLAVVPYKRGVAARTNVKRQQSTLALTGVRKRGSNRRIPEKENVTDCPECGRKGQSIFDPSISDREGHVWQYFYCRNSMCSKGRSCNRYIGWAIRPVER